MSYKPTRCTEQADLSTADTVSCCINIVARERDRERQTERDRETDRERERETERQTERERLPVVVINHGD